MPTCSLHKERRVKQSQTLHNTANNVITVFSSIHGVVVGRAANGFDGRSDHFVGGRWTAWVQEDQGVDAVCESDAGEIGVVEQLAECVPVAFGEAVACSGLV
jgi:hypothetical protein